MFGILGSLCGGQRGENYHILFLQPSHGRKMHLRSDMLPPSKKWINCTSLVHLRNLIINDELYLCLMRAAYRKLWTQCRTIHISYELTLAFHTKLRIDCLQSLMSEVLLSAFPGSRFCFASGPSAALPFVPQIVLACSSLIERKPKQPPAKKRKECNKEFNKCSKKTKKNARKKVQQCNTECGKNPTKSSLTYNYFTALDNVEYLMIILMKA